MHSLEVEIKPSEFGSLTGSGNLKEVTNKIRVRDIKETEKGIIIKGPKSEKY